MSYAYQNLKANNHQITYSSTSQYLWDTSPSNVLGRGATAVVYKAFKKDTGEDCAVKVFHDRVSHHYSSVPIRELEIVSKLNHKNVIRIFGIDTEPNNGNKVLGMEFCAGGSLYTQLDQPEHCFGFPEEEFLIVLGDIAHGMKYLRDNGIIHRDIKPGNIMQFIDDDGRSVYKLTDFGAARQLEEEENFMSIYGTEEYLDPAMYNQAVLKNQFGQQFSATVDIWSLGVTIYHVCTGQLPFQPYGGRSNTATMYRITTEKESGVISGVQRYNDGPIDYKKELPRTCLLSPCLKSRIVPILAGLMESNMAVRWSYDRFFNAVDELIQMKIFKVFDCSSGTNLKVYINKHEKYARLQDLIAMETEIPAAEQLILYHNRELGEMVDSSMVVDSYPKRLLVEQLYVYNKERMDRQNLTLPEIPPFPNMPDHTSLDRDSHYLHKICGIGYHIVKVIELCIQDQQLLQESEVHLRDYILVITNKIDNCLPDMTIHLEENKKRQEAFYESYKNLLSLVMTLESYEKSLERIERKLRPLIADKSPEEVLSKAENRCEEVKVYMSVLVEKMKEQEQEAISSCHSCLEQDRCIQKAGHLASLLKETWQMFSKHRKQRNLTTDEEFIHNARKAKAQEYSGQILSVLEGHCKMKMKQTYLSVMKQNGLLVKNLQRTKKVNQNIKSVMECRGKLSDRIDRMDSECRKITKELTEVLSFSLKSESASATPMRMETQMKRPEESLASVEPWSSIGLEKISLGLKSLMDSRLELSNVMDSTKKSLDESAEILESLGKKPAPSSDDESESEVRTPDGISRHVFSDPPNRQDTKTTGRMPVQISEDQPYRIPDGSSAVSQPSDAVQ